MNNSTNTKCCQFIEAEYLHQWTRPSLVQIMVCRLFGGKPLSEPNARILLIGHMGNKSVKFDCDSRKHIWKCVLRHVGHFVSTAMCYSVANFHMTTLLTNILHGGLSQWFMYMLIWRSFTTPFYSADVLITSIHEPQVCYFATAGLWNKIAKSLASIVHITCMVCFITSDMPFYTPSRAIVTCTRHTVYHSQGPPLLIWINFNPSGYVIICLVECGMK